MIKRVVIVFLLVLVVFAASWSLLRPDFFRTHDFVHAARLAEMQRGILDGQWPVRWSQNFGYGYGMPLFQFYAPLPYLVGALFLIVGFSAVLTIKLIIILSTIVTAWGGFRLGGALFGSAGGILTATALTLAPYRAVNIFVRGALSETWGMMALPWILYGLLQISRGKFSTGWWITTVSTVVLLLSHNLTSLIFLPVAGVFGLGLVGLQALADKTQELAQTQTRDSLKKLLLMAGSFGLAGLMSSFYVLPALLEKGLTKVEDTIITDYFNYQLHFLYPFQFFTENWGYGGSSWGPEDGFSFFLGSGQIVALLLALVLLFMQLKKLWSPSQAPLWQQKIAVFLQRISKTHLGIGLLTIILLAFSLFMTLHRSEFIWEVFSFLRYLQFPWRWLAVVSLFLSLLAGLAMGLISQQHRRIIVFSSLFLLIIVVNWRYFQPESYLRDSEEYYYVDASLIREEMSFVLPDYIPSDLSEALPVAYTLVDINLLDSGASLRLGKEVEIIVEKAHQKSLVVTLSEPTELKLNLAAYPGWTVTVNDQPILHRVTSQGLIAFDLEAGISRVEVTLKNTLVRAISDGFSLMGWVSFATLLFWQAGLVKLKEKAK
jgi:hypothetical protein